MNGSRSFIFTSVVKFAFFIINVFAVYLFFRGHNLPGGGFIAGLASAISLILLSLAIGIDQLARILRVDSVRIAAIGLLISVASASVPMLVDEAFLTQVTWHLHDVPLFGELHVGLPMVFDLGVFLVVIGICTKIIFVLTQSTGGVGGLNSEEQQRYSSSVEVRIEDGQSREGEVHDAD